jgi:hypothetical protein
VDAFLAALEASAFAEALRTSFVAYPLVNAFHILALGALVTAVILLDLRVLGGLRSVAGEPFIALMRRVALLAFAGAAVSGFLLFSVRPIDYAGNPAFLAKLALIGLAVLNFALLAHSGRGRGRAEAPSMRVAAVLSLVFWPAALVAGRFIGFVE